MNFELPDILKVIGPAASIIFAAWIFMGFLQARYDAAVGRFRSLIGDYRDGDLSEDRRTNIREIVAAYRRRCRLMNTACIVGLVSAILLLLGLMAGELSVIFPRSDIFKYAGASSAFLGFCLVIAAAVLVIIESLGSQRQLDNECGDIPGLSGPRPPPRKEGAD
ncbi:MAG: DUF2721 domain-containing protein [Alphaproteobacteria bacterium]|nr:DUF2721 domain-containing protein [Alphaproteobacteria bacterium]